MDTILSLLLLIGIPIILYIIREVRQASNPDDVWKLRFSLEVVGIIVAILAFLLAAGEIRESTLLVAVEIKESTSARKADAINRDWDVVYTSEATSIRRTKALQNLAKLGESFEKIDLSCAAIEGKSQKFDGFPECDMEKVPLEYLDLSPEAIGIEKGVNLQEAKLMNVNLFSANLTDANLTDADLVEADLTSADLVEADLTSADLGGADLTSADLGGADLTSADLGGADLTSATFVRATLTDADLGGADLTSAYLEGADLSSAYLERADLTSAFLGRANLTGADLGLANLTSAHLVYTNLTAANLSKTDFSDATISEDTVLDYTWVWEGDLPRGTPKGWDTKLKPEYICPSDFSISKHIKVSEYSSEEQEKLKNALGKIIEEECEPYNNAPE